MRKNKINVEEIVKSQAKDWADFGEGLDKSNLTPEEIKSLKISLSEAELLAYKTKLGFEIHLFAKTGEYLSSRDFLVKMLGYLPENVSGEYLSALTEFVLERHEAMNRKMAA